MPVIGNFPLDGGFQPWTANFLTHICRSRFKHCLGKSGGLGGILKLICFVLHLLQMDQKQLIICILSPIKGVICNSNTLLHK